MTESILNDKTNEPILKDDLKSVAQEDSSPEESASQNDIDLLDSVSTFSVKNFMTPNQMSKSRTNLNTHVKNPMESRGQKRSIDSIKKVDEPPQKIIKFGPREGHLLPRNQVLNYYVFCSICEFSTKVRYNMVRHLQLHAEQQPDSKTDYTPSTVMIPPGPATRYPKHVPEIHNSTDSASLIQISPVAPTMDLKPWQCGLCKYRSWLRQKVANHCVKLHNSKKQYMCSYCGFGTYYFEHVTKHLSTSHVGKQKEILYCYYQKGSIPDDLDGVPLWQKQRKEFIVSVKPITPLPDTNLQLPIITGTFSLRQTDVPENQNLDLNLDKKESAETSPKTVEILCKEFGEFCGPNDLKYSCPLCKYTEDTVEAMQFHLYEKLKYRKWGCSICSYKAFHKTDLKKHMQIKHRQNREPVRLPVNDQIESWVTKLLEHQTALILIKKENLEKQKGQKSNKPPSDTNAPVVISVSENSSMSELENTFGSFGAPANMSFCCPKCKALFKEESAMENHLQDELCKMRWSCCECSENFQVYREVLIHAMSVHGDKFRNPVKVNRDIEMHLSWIAAVIRVQKSKMNYSSLQKDLPPETLENDEPENSLLTVRYEEIPSNS